MLEAIENYLISETVSSFETRKPKIMLGKRKIFYFGKN